MSEIVKGDMLVKLYNLPDHRPLLDKLAAQGISIKRVLAPDRGRVLEFVQREFGDGWMRECELALCTQPATCYVAVKDKQIIGFGCFEATAKNYFGPVGVQKDCRAGGVGAALTLACLHAMWELGYGYAIIGWVGDARGFYEKICDATFIPDSHPGVYKRMVRFG